MANKFFSGNTLEQAVLQAARFFELAPEEVAFKQVERRHGFLKVRRRVVIGVNPDDPRRAAAEASQEASAREATVSEPEVAPLSGYGQGKGPEEDSTESPEEDRGTGRSDDAGGEAAAATATAGPSPAPVSERATESRDVWESLSRHDATEAAEESLRRLFRLGDLELQVEVVATEDGLEIELSGEDEDHLFEDRGRLLLALQHLLPRMIRGLTGASVPCQVDSDNFHEVRAEQLRVMAQDAAEEVRRERRMQTLEPMSPDERRIVHLTLADDPAVETESHGTGLFKRVAVRPVSRRA